MTHQEILTKAIEKAIVGGWNDYNSLESLKLISTIANTITLEGWVEYVEEGETDEAKIELTFNYKEIIFNHDFAKALWGDSISLYGIAKRNIAPGFVTPKDVRDLRKMYLWQYHLQQMVIADDPIVYLGENI